MVFTSMVVLTHRLVTLNNHKERKEFRGINVPMAALLCPDCSLSQETGKQMRKNKSKFEQAQDGLETPNTIM